MRFTVALVGLDGAGKTTIARLLEASGGGLRHRYLYMGRSLASANASLPTSRLVRAFTPSSPAVSGTGAVEPARTAEATAPQRRVGGKRRRGSIRMAASLANRLVEAWWRQLVSFLHRLRGYVVIYDRHYLFESAMALGGRRAAHTLDRLEFWLFSRAYPKPGLVIFLDVPPQVAYARKGELSIRRLWKRRAALLETGRQLPHFVPVDADRPLEQVLADVRKHLSSFDAARSRQIGPRDRVEERR